MYRIQLNGTTSRSVTTILQPSSSPTVSPARTSLIMDKTDTATRTSTKATPAQNRTASASGHQVAVFSTTGASSGAIPMVGPVT